MRDTSAATVIDLVVRAFRTRVRALRVWRLRVKVNPFYC